MTTADNKIKKREHPGIRCFPDLHEEYNISFVQLPEFRTMNQRLDSNLRWPRLKKLAKLPSQANAREWIIYSVWSIYI